MAKDKTFVDSPTKTSPFTTPSNILFYIRKSDDVDEILDALRDCVLHISSRIPPRNKSGESLTINLHMEGWALDCLEDHMKDVNFTEIIGFDEKRTL